MIEIRPAAASDEEAIARVRADSWTAGYTGILAPEVIARATARPRPVPAAPPVRADGPSWRQALVAVAGEPRAVIGFAVFGPERHRHPVPRTARPAPGRELRSLFTPDGEAAQTGEVYALYVAPAWWSRGAGRSLMTAALDSLRVGGYGRAVLWVLAENARARRFYGKAGFAPDGLAKSWSGQPGVLEVRYARTL